MKSRFIFLMLLCSLTSCSYLTKQGRQERAYRNYVRKSTVVKAKQQRKFKFRTPEMAIRQDSPNMTAEPGSSQSPQSMTASPEAEQQPPPPN
jgi:hypothetical protein